MASMSSLTATLCSRAFILASRSFVSAMSTSLPRGWIVHPVDDLQALGLIPIPHLPVDEVIARRLDLPLAIYLDVLVVVERGALYAFVLQGDDVVLQSPRAHRGRFAGDRDLRLMSLVHGQYGHVHVALQVLHDGIPALIMLAPIQVAGDSILRK